MLFPIEPETNPRFEDFRIPTWYDLKLAMVAWLVLPQFRGAAFIYEKFVREKLITKYGARYFRDKSSPPVTPPKVSVKPSEDRTD
ncbi:hypothetical protein H5410_033961 [Solanum commersonii]|uniref:HVA22-like protein n=1 Tax=Solanum commersonii TaxID=4109 RepID=A0A9J5YS37_SOLCO|nr:hypothetical protein H5410_033961 [Solanum commersonii]